MSGLNLNLITAQTLTASTLPTTRDAKGDGTAHA